MKLPKHLVLLTLTACVVYTESTVAHPIGPFLEARQAFRDGNEKQLLEISYSLEDHILFPYIEYWKTRLRIRQLTKYRFDQFIKNNADHYVSNKLRRDWLIELARRKKWKDFLLYFKDLRNVDTALTCMEKVARYSLGKTLHYQDIKKIWLTSQSQPRSCTPLFKILFKNNILNSSDAWERFRIALERENLMIARAALSYLPKERRPNGWILNNISSHPEKFLENKPASKWEREYLIFAIHKTVVKSPNIALKKLRTIDPYLSSDEKSYAWGQIGLITAQAHNRQSLELFSKARLNDLNPTQKAWRVRAALREGRWPEVLSTIDAMHKLQRNKDVWQYWLGYGKCETKQPYECRNIMRKISKKDNYYGSLANIFLNTPEKPIPKKMKISPHDITKLMGNISLKTALYFFKHGQRYQGALEWDWAVKDFSPAELLIAAEIARQNKWYERAIFTMNKSEKAKNIYLGYPTPYLKIVTRHSENFGLPKSWVLGLIKQESRFLPQARSPAGAIGLMQLIPSTAKSMSQSLGRIYMRKHMYQPDKNITIGTFYLKRLLNKHQHPVLATAAYNAGPRRALSWQANDDLLPAVFIETIPFNETRRYVKSVLHNTIRYDQILKTSKFGKKTLLDMIPGK